MQQNSDLVITNIESLVFLLNECCQSLDPKLSVTSCESMGRRGFILSNANIRVRILNDSENVILKFSKISKMPFLLDSLVTMMTRVSIFFLPNPSKHLGTILRSFIEVWESMLNQFPSARLIVQVSKMNNVYSIDVKP